MTDTENDDEFFMCIFETRRITIPDIEITKKYSHTRWDKTFRKRGLPATKLATGMKKKIRIYECKKMFQ